MFSKQEFIKNIDTQGYAVIENVIDDSMINKIIPEIEKAIKLEGREGRRK